MVNFQETSIFSTISSVFSSYGPAVLNGLIVVSTIGSQSLIKRLTFSCPCKYPLNVYQSLFFLFGPCLALFLFAVLLNQNTWRLVHGCCFRVPSARHPFSTVLLYWTQIVGQAMIAPVAWLFVALLDGGYYTCLRAAEFCANSTLCEQPIAGSQAKICDACVCAPEPDTVAMLQSLSQLLAWTLLVSVGVIALSTICTIRMCDRYTYVQSNYVKIYRETEKTVFEAMAKEMATVTAQNNSRAFFGKQRLLKEDWDLLSSLPSLEDPFMFARHLRGRDRIRPEEWASSSNNTYTTLQRWNNRATGQVAAETQQNGHAESVPVDRV